MFKFLALLLCFCSFCQAKLYILETFRSTYIDELHGFLIYDDSCHKYGYYITDYFLSFPHDPNQIVKYKPRSFKEAKKTFPKYNLKKRDYILSNASGSNSSLTIHRSRSKICLSDKIICYC